MEPTICENDPIPERRRTPRMPYRTTAHYKTASVEGAGTISDISADGLFLETPAPLNAGDQIRIAFLFRNSKRPMNISGEIARRTHTGVGIRFLWT